METNNRVNELITMIGLTPHPEGGFYKETYRSSEIIPQSVLPIGYSGPRNSCTAIYFLITSGNFSAFHRILQDEIWHYYEGTSALLVHEINAEGKYICHKVGPDLANHERPQVVIPKESWFASEVALPDSYAFVGCTVSPGFDFSDFELADRNRLIAQFPQHSEIITHLTRLTT